jgi:hypothetical protein
MDYLFIKFLLKKLNSKKTANEVSSHISQTGVTIEKIVIDSLIDRGLKSREAQIKFGELESEFKTKKKKAIQFFSAIILLIIVCIFSANSIQKFIGDLNYINDSTVNEFKKPVVVTEKDSCKLTGNGNIKDSNNSGEIKIDAVQKPINTDSIGKNGYRPKDYRPKFIKKGGQFYKPRKQPVINNKYIENKIWKNRVKSQFKKGNKDTKKFINKNNLDNLPHEDIRKEFNEQYRELKRKVPKD